MCKYLALKGTTNSNYNVQELCFWKGPKQQLYCVSRLLYFQRGFTTISNVQIKKSFKRTSIPKTLWVKISSKKFWKDPIKQEQIFIPNDNFLYQMIIFHTKWWFLEIGMFSLLIIFWKCHSLKKISKWSRKNKEKVRKHEGWWKM